MTTWSSGRLNTLKKEGLGPSVRQAMQVRIGTLRGNEVLRWIWGLHPRF